MDYCMREYDLTIVDTPPANTSSDARRISTVCGYSLIVTRQNVSLTDDVKTLMAQIRGDHGRVIGTVLNEA
jgi:Mrp family chromosome partitioning ATPase